MDRLVPMLLREEGLSVIAAVHIHSYDSMMVMLETVRSDSSR